MGRVKIVAVRKNDMIRYDTCMYVCIRSNFKAIKSLIIYQRINFLTYVFYKHDPLMPYRK